MKDVVLIPAYQPDKQLIQVVENLSENDLGILIVDDGSGSDYADIFDAVKDKAQVVHIPCNGGKGAALKNGMASIKRIYPDCEFFVTADADGQHKCEDILRVFKELHHGAEFVLTVRQFDRDMPFRSKFGNNLSKWIYTILNGHFFEDNQSGLRGFSTKHIEWLLKVGGDKYDYEMNMLYYADKQGVSITTIPIEAIYIDNNSSSHFNPVKDTLRIYARLFWSARITFAAILIIEQLLLAATFIYGYKHLHITIPTIGSVGVVFTFILNQFVVFRGFKYRDHYRLIIYSILRYTAYTWALIMISFVAPKIPLIIAFNLIAIAIMPLEYIMHKLLYRAKYKDINRTA
ncbi:MAG: glycosyltransferase family 2 protein [Ruminococcaceae bacterium]|nr:glycosyltransferase family 2 protein [Oscillospiraceae bacterium]